MKRGDELTVTLERFAFEGKSVARVEGLVVFVTGAVPGDTVRVRCTRTKKSFCEAEAVAILTPSALRTVPRCGLFGICGGCRWQNVAYDAQCSFKRQHVIDALERIGGFRGIEVAATIGCDDPYFYRNKMEFSFGERWLTRDELAAGREGGAMYRFALGLHPAGRFDRVLDVDACWLQSEFSNRILAVARSFARERALTVYSTHTHSGYLRNLVIRQSRHTDDIMVNVVTRDDRPEIMRELCTALLRECPGITTVVNNITERLSQVALGDREVIVHGPGTITERIGKRTYRISANSFFQTNTLQAERLYDTARRLARLREEDIVYDLYSGTGTIALHIADDVRQVVGVESVAPAVEDARRNAEGNGVTNCAFILGDLKDVLTKHSQLLAPFGAPDVMIIDPPRAGMHDNVLRRVLEIAPARIVYVSCNPATQARDLALLSPAYTIGEVQPVDMFPHTFHIENVVALSR